MGKGCGVINLIESKQALIDRLVSEGKKIFRVLSFGGGTQSAWLLDQHIKGHIDYDLIVFADTGAEPAFIHQQVAWWRKRTYERGTPFRIVTHNQMRRGLEEMLFRYIFTDYDRFQMVAHCEGAGMLPRQCTVDFKITPVLREARRAVMGERKVFPDDWVLVVDIGFAVDEQRRAKRNQSMQYKYAWLTYPMIDAGITVEESLRYLRERGYPDQRSRCYFCPFQSDTKLGMSWQEIIKREPFSFLKACWLDEKIREAVRSGNKRLRNLPYFHHSRQPLIDRYRDDYSRISAEYETELLVWIDEMKNLIA